ncbi:MAG: hypothetical protein H6Q64_1719, partial [Firmicutes bacterium]|nr:hypothetical protein [Bacillota bacterium]
MHINTRQKHIFIYLLLCSLFLTS